ncbi:hypothetical protein [Aquimarina pacifica]|uniref:hypothetical protein n=1 Tax=Aquimarina pacifica TaxID=1296415 RepID=UPI0012691914|nr:hypothetical protein [Aquimarina pacifica]
MKKILNLSGVRELSKRQQQQIKGSAIYISCCGTNQCRITLSSGASFCEPGRCNRFGSSCILY